MEWLSKETKALIREMSVGIAVFNVILGIAVVLVFPGLGQPVLPALGGLAFGMAGAIMMLVHMAVMTERVLDTQNPSYANKTIVVHSMIRKLLFVLAVLVCWRIFGINMLAAVIGAMGLKAGAYLQPMVHRVFEGRKKDTDSKIS